MGDNTLLFAETKLISQLLEFDMVCRYLVEVEQLIEGTDDPNIAEFNAMLADDAIASYDKLVNAIFVSFEEYFAAEKKYEMPIKFETRILYNRFKKVRD